MSSISFPPAVIREKQSFIININVVESRIVNNIGSIDSIVIFYNAMLFVPSEHRTHSLRLLFCVYKCTMIRTTSEAAAVACAKCQYAHTIVSNDYAISRGNFRRRPSSVGSVLQCCQRIRDTIVFGERLLLILYLVPIIIGIYENIIFQQY